MNEADTCRRYVTPALRAAGWDNEPHRINEQVSFTDGRIVVSGGNSRRQPGKRADYILRYSADMALAVVEAKPYADPPGTGLQQAKEYAEILGLKFAYATNGQAIVEFDRITGLERTLQAYPTPQDLWARLRSGEGLDDAQAERALAPGHVDSTKRPRYYQEIAINRTVQAAIKGRKRILLTMATGTGKTFVAFQICWRLWSSGWTLARSEARPRPRILYLADRHVLIDDPKDKMFAPFGDARFKIENGNASKGREMYFALYQSIAEDERREGLFREYPEDFFDLVIVDECHRGSASRQSSWRSILEYFSPACQLGMTATPLRDENRDTYDYFGEPIYTYSLRQGIEDGFLAPYRVHRIVTTWDAAGWRPSVGDRDRYGREIPDDEYQTGDFERVIALRARTEAVARHLSDFLKETDRFAKTIVFCVDQEHADEMRRALNNFNADLVRDRPDYVCRVTSADEKIGRGHLSRFQDVEQTTPAILTTSQMLTTGVDAPTVKNVVLVRVVNSSSEFKQIIGRGTRVRADYDKLFFNILDYTGSATRQFADPDFDGEPASVREVDIGDGTEPPVVIFDPDAPQPESESTDPPGLPGDLPPRQPRKYYIDEDQPGGIATHMVHEVGIDGKQLRVVEILEFTAEGVRSIYRDPEDLRADWADPARRADLVERLAERGIDLAELAKATKRPDADPLDLLCHLAYDAPLRTRSERARRAKSEHRNFFEEFAPEARAILEELLDMYAERGPGELQIPEALELEPVRRHGTVPQIGEIFGGNAELRRAVQRLQSILYAR